MSVFVLRRRRDSRLVLTEILSLIVLFLSFPINSFAQLIGLCINEFMASNELAYENAVCDYADCIEIHNSSSSAIDRAAYLWTDDLQARNHWRIVSRQSAKTTVPANRGHFPFKQGQYWLDLA
jgi:hypothetical protein